MRIEPIPDWGLHTADDDWEELYQHVPSLTTRLRRMWFIRYRTTWWWVATDDESYISFDDARKLILLAS